MRIHELQATRAKAVEELTALEAKMAAPDYVEDAADNKAFDAKMDEIGAIDTKIKRAKAVQDAAAASATPVAGQVAPLAAAQARKVLYTSHLKAFKDRRDDNGLLVRAEDQAYRVGMWAKAAIFGDPVAAEWCKANGLPLTRAQAENVNTSGGFLVPEEMMATIIVLREVYGVARQEAQIIPMGRDTLNWPRRTGGTTAYFVGEGAAGTASTVTFDSINLTARKAMQLVLMSNEIAEDAIVQIGDIVTNEVAYAFSALEDNCLVNGDGTSTYGNIKGLVPLAIDSTRASSKFTAASGHNTFALLDNTDLTGAMGKLPKYVYQGGNVKWHCSQLAFDTLFGRLMAAGGGNRIDTLTGELVYRYLGYPVCIWQQMPNVATSLAGAAMLWFGDMRRAVAFGERRQITLRRSEDRYFDQDSVAILGTERFDIQCHDVGGASGTLAGPLIAIVAP